MNIFSYEMLFAVEGGEEKEFIRPNLTANGTLGGNDFAVGGTTSSLGYPLYYAVDGKPTTYWRLSSNGYYIFYNPKPLNVTRLYLNCTSRSYTPNTDRNYLIIQGSNDNSTYTEISKTISAGTSLVQLELYNNSSYYKYYRLTLRPANSQIRLTELEITATYKE